MLVVVLVMSGAAKCTKFFQWKGKSMVIRLMRNIQSVLLLLVFVGCESVAPIGKGGGNEQVWTEVYTNQPSGFLFPTQIGNFIRQSVKEYDAKGENVGVGYNDLANSIAMTVYVYPHKLAEGDSTIEGHLAALNSQILEIHKNA